VTIAACAAIAGAKAKAIARNTASGLLKEFIISPA